MTNKQLESYIRKNEFDVQNARAAFLFLDMVYSSYADSDDIHGVNYSPVLSYESGLNFYQILNKSSVDGTIKNVYLRYKRNKKSLNKIINEHKKITREIDDLWKKYYNESKNISNRKILEYFSKVMKLEHDWWKYGVIGEDKCEIINKEIVPAFQKRYKLKHDKAKDIINILSSPEELTYFNQERLDFLQICLKIREKNIDKVIGRYLKKYFWVKSDFYKSIIITHETILREAKKEIQKQKESGIKKEIKKIENYISKVKKEKEKVLKSVKLKKEDKDDLYFAEEIIKWFDFRKVIYMGHFYHISLMLENIADRFNIKYELLTFCIIKEVKELLQKGKLASKNELSKRSKSAFCLFEKKKPVKFFYNVEGKKFFDLMINKEKSENLIGSVASLGGKKKVEGIVKVISDPKEVDFKKGDILVTSMTRVEFVPLMRKAKAIITNEGGIACHAAVVSRELNIPCIIGTKHATKSLKTGDKVEMDLRTGKIKKLIR